jgi:NAD(P)-dependent dehydrogenase (short-subunit alcohol dehydrogenase family)
LSEAGLKTLILTGASRGIGHATVKRFSQEGWRIITCSREDVPDECRRDPNWNRHITVDLADPRAVETFVAEANAALAGAPLHALVTMRRSRPRRPSGAAGHIEWRARCLARGLRAHFFAPLARPRLRARPSSWAGTIVNITSIAGHAIHPFAGSPTAPPRRRSRR